MGRRAVGGIGWLSAALHGRSRLDVPAISLTSRVHRVQMAMKGFIMPKPQLRMGFAAVVLLTVFSLGCESQIARENRDLYKQNRELQARLDAERAQQPRAEPPHLVEQPAPQVTQTPQVARQPDAQPPVQAGPVVQGP